MSHLQPDSRTFAWNKFTHEERDEFNSDGWMVETVEAARRCNEFSA